MQNHFSKSIFRAVILSVILLMVCPEFSAQAQENKPATWIWYPGDFEVWLSNKMQVRRTEPKRYFSALTHNQIPNQSNSNT